MTKRQGDRPAASARPKTARVTDLRRRSGIREQRTTILAVTNGESTEYAYLTRLRQERGGRSRLVVAVEKGSPTEAIRGAARRRDESDIDEAYVVCDVDRYPVPGPTSEARQLGVTLLWSNPSFEIWLILHHADCTKYLEDAKKARDLLRRYVKNWDKTKLDFEDFRGGVSDAVDRARKLGEAPDANPSTAVWKLVEALR